MLPEFGCLSKAYPNYLNLLSLQNWPRQFLALSYWTWLGSTYGWPFIKIFGTSDSGTAYIKLQTKN